MYSHYFTAPDSMPARFILIRSNGAAITDVVLTDQPSAAQPDPLALACADELQQYFHGQRQQFTVPLAPAGTPFQQQVWQQLRQIPCGVTWSYRQLAERIGSPRYSRAVGAANGRNPIAIIIPCHRVIGSSGKLVGYAGGVDNKQWLLELEKHFMRDI
ncbi:MAG: methylated-DNA--[protein]-cysteine S-methyltransferase [Enterobacteriaceae bacterium]